MSKSRSDETTPDELMESFQGRSLKSIILFTVVIHAVLLLGTSVPFIIKAVTGKDTGELSEEERLELAMKDATASLREIAEEYGVNPQEISRGFSDEGPKKAGNEPEGESTPKPTPESGDNPVDPAAGTPIEQEIRVTKEGPDVPKVGEEEEDLFK